MKSVVQTVCLLLATQYCTAAAIPKFPPFIDICPDNSNFDRCLEKAIEKSLKGFKNGYPSLGILPVDPLRITSVDIDQGTGPVSIILKFKDLDIHGLSNAKIRNLKADMKNLVFTTKVYVPKITLDGMYSVDGKVLVLPIKGAGKSKIVLDDVNFDLIFAGKHYKKDGETHMKVTKFDFVLNSKKLIINLENLFNGDKALSENMNKFLNENSLDILKELAPAVQQAFGIACQEIANRLFTRIPFYQVFPDFKPK